MKFTDLSTKFNKLIKKQKKGAKIKPKKVNKLIDHLTSKKLKYEKKLKTDLSKKKRTSFETKLKVVNAQIAKSKKLL